jgi:hypothetical protein
LRKRIRWELVRGDVKVVKEWGVGNNATESANDVRRNERTISGDIEFSS